MPRYPRVRRFPALLHIDLKNPPTTIQRLIEAFYPKHPERQALALFLLRKAKAGGWDRSEWLRVLLEFLYEYSKVYNIQVAPENIHNIIMKYDELDGKVSNTTRNKKIYKLAGDVGLDLANWQYHYRAVTWVLRNAGLLYLKGDHFGLSKGLLRYVRYLSDALVDFYSGSEEVV